MPRHQLEIPHKLTPAEVRSRLDGALPNLESRYGATCQWDGDKLRIARTGLTATVEIEAERVRIDLDLALLLSPMAGGIKGGIQKQLTDLLA